MPLLTRTAVSRDGLRSGVLYVQDLDFTIFGDVVIPLPQKAFLGVFRNQP
jgi:hypothetical protein